MKTNVEWRFERCEEKGNTNKVKEVSLRRMKGGKRRRK
jgi:hypothetical protein